jgi:Cu-Zn family superoxide dismutase
MNAICYFNPVINNGVNGTIKFHQCKQHLNCFILIELEGLKPNSIVGCHIHEFGNLTKGCASAGKHYNPMNESHGSVYYSKKRHVGDLLNNIQSDKDGKVNISFNDDLVNVQDIIGRTIVIHSSPDDYGLQGIFRGDNTFIKYSDMNQSMLSELVKKLGYYQSDMKKDDMITKLNQESKITGNAGSRIACAIIGIDK